MPQPAIPRIDEALLGQVHAALAAAERVCWFEPLLVPGPLQTREYALAVLRGVNVPALTDVDAERIYGRRRGPRLDVTRFVVAEAALRLQVGGPEVMAAQFAYLAAMEGRVASLRVLPASAGAVPGVLWPLVLTDDPAEGCVFRELAPGSEVFTAAAEEPGLVAAWREAWDAIEGASVPWGEYV